MRRRYRSKGYSRPFATHYYHGTHDRVPSAGSHGSCASEDNAKRAAVVRLILGQFAMARIIDRNTGAIILTLRRYHTQISLSYGTSGE